MDFVKGLLQNILAAALGYLAARLQEWYKRKRRREALKALVNSGSTREALLMVSCREDIEMAVRQERARLNLQVGDDAFVKVHQDGIFPSDEAKWMEYVARIREAALEIRKGGYGRIHLFTNVPVAMAVFAGALLDNGPEVVVYHYFSGEYRRVGSLSVAAMHLA